MDNTIKIPTVSSFISDFVADATKNDKGSGVTEEIKEQRNERARIRRLIRYGHDEKETR